MSKESKRQKGKELIQQRKEKKQNVSRPRNSAHPNAEVHTRSINNHLRGPK